jgi:hypothetical protein
VKAMLRRMVRHGPAAYLVDIGDAYLRYRKHVGRWPNLWRPTTFQEWVQRRKLFDRRPEFAIFADKVAVRDYVAQRVGAEVLPELLDVYARAEQYDPSHLPRSYVLKAAAGTAMTEVVADRDRADHAALRRRMKVWLRTNLYDITREAPYRAVRQRVLAEENVSSADGTPPIDYKFFCFNGRPVMIHLFVGRGTAEYMRSWYSCDWQFLNIVPRGRLTRPIERPPHLAEMIAVAERLSAGFDFLRVDLYDIPRGPLFGELTFHPGNGVSPLTNEEWRVRLGTMWAEARRQLRS